MRVSATAGRASTSAAVASLPAARFTNSYRTSSNSLTCSSVILSPPFLPAPAGPASRAVLLRPCTSLRPVVEWGGKETELWNTRLKPL